MASLIPSVDPYRPCLLPCTGDAEGGGGIEFETGDGDELAAGEAFAVGFVVTAFQGRLEPAEFLLAPARGSLRHGLNLHRIHARKPSEPGLIQLDRSTVALRLSQQLEHLTAPLPEQLPEPRDVGFLFQDLSLPDPQTSIRALHGLRAGDGNPT